MYFCPVAKPKGQAADILKEWRCSNALSAAHKNLVNSNRLHDKAMSNAHYGSLYILLVYTNSVGYGIAYLQTVGITRAFMCGMSNSSDTRASFFGVFLA